MKRIATTVIICLLTHLTFAQNFGIGIVNPAARLHVFNPDDEIATIYATGSNQGSGMIYAGQSTSYGGGFVYDGDGTPTLVGGTDRITFFRRQANTDSEVMSYAYNNSTLRVNSLAGSGDRAVVANANGDLSTVSGVKVYRSQTATGNQYPGYLPGDITFYADAGDQVTLRISYSGRPDAWGHTYIDLYLDGVIVKGLGEEQNSTWRRTIDGEVHLTISSTGNHTFRAYFSCGSGTSYMRDTGGEWPNGGLTRTVIVGDGL